MLKRFIILVDFSEHSGNVIKYVSEWCAKIHAEILLVHQTVALVPAFAHSDTKSEILRLASAEALQKLKSLAQELVPPHITVSFSVTTNHLNAHLAKFLHEPFENVIVVGVKGTNILKKIFLGSTAIQVVDDIDNIVFAVPQNIAAFAHKRLFVAVSEKFPLNTSRFNAILRFLEPENISITFFHIHHNDEESHNILEHLESLTELFAERYQVNYTIFSGDNPLNDIQRILNTPHDVLLLQKGSRLLSDQVFRKFLINELIYDGKTPLIILP